MQIKGNYIIDGPATGAGIYIGERQSNASVTRSWKSIESTAEGTTFVCECGTRIFQRFEQHGCYAPIDHVCGRDPESFDAPRLPTRITFVDHTAPARLGVPGQPYKGDGSYKRPYETIYEAMSEAKKENALAVVQEVKAPPGLLSRILRRFTK